VSATAYKIDQLLLLLCCVQFFFWIYIVSELGGQLLPFSQTTDLFLLLKHKKITIIYKDVGHYPEFVLEKMVECLHAFT